MLKGDRLLYFSKFAVDPDIDVGFDGYDMPDFDFETDVDPDLDDIDIDKIDEDLI